MTGVDRPPVGGRALQSGEQAQGRAGKATVKAPTRSAVPRRPARSSAGSPSRQERRRDGRPTDVIFGKHSVRAVFRARPQAVRRVVMREGAVRYLQEFVDLARKAGIEPEMVRSGEFLRMGGLDEDDKHQGIFVIADPLELYSEHDFGLLDDASVVVVLDQVSNPQNFGTIIRTAAFFGVDGVIWVKDRAADIDSTVSRIAVGGTELVKLFRVTNLARSLQLLKDRGFWVYGFDERGERTLAETSFEAKSAVIIGAEGEGMRQRTKAFCDELVCIPGGQPGLESLNAAVAAGIVMAEIVRGRTIPPHGSPVTGRFGACGDNSAQNVSDLCSPVPSATDQTVPASRQPRQVER